MRHLCSNHDETPVFCHIALVLLPFSWLIWILILMPPLLFKMSYCSPRCVLPIWEASALGD